MARGERGKSGQRAPRPCSLRLGERSEEGRVPGEAPTALPAPPQSPRAARASSSSSRLAAGRGQGPVVTSPRRTSPSPQHPPFAVSSPQPTRACSNPTGAKETQKKARPPGPEPRRSRSRSARSSIPGGRSRARGRREGAIQRGCAGMLSGRPVAAVRLPAPASGRSPRRCWTRAAGASLPSSGVAWRGSALPAAGLCGRGEAGARTPARRRQGARESGLGAE